MACEYAGVSTPVLEMTIRSPVELSGYPFWKTISHRYVDWFLEFVISPSSVCLPQAITLKVLLLQLDSNFEIRMCVNSPTFSLLFKVVSLFWVLCIFLWDLEDQLIHLCKKKKRGSWNLDKDYSTDLTAFQQYCIFWPMKMGFLLSRSLTSSSVVL